MSRLIHTTVSPAATVTPSGWNRMPSINTVCTRGAAFAAPVMPAAGSRRNTNSGMARAARRARTFMTYRSSLARLQALRMIAVRDESRPHLDQQRFQFRVRGARNERLIERVDDLLVIGVFMIDVGLVER